MKAITNQRLRTLRKIDDAMNRARRLARKQTAAANRRFGHYMETYNRLWNSLPYDSPRP